MLTNTFLYLIFTIITGTSISSNWANERFSLQEMLFLVILTGFFFPPILLFALASLHVFSKTTFVLTWLIIIILTTIISVRNRKFHTLFNILKNINYKESTAWLLLHIVVAISFFTYYQRPSEWLLSTGMDASNYVIQAGYQLEHPSLYFESFQGEVYKESFADAKYNTNSTNGQHPNFPFPPLNKLFLAVAMFFSLKLTFYAHLFIAGISYLSLSISAHHLYKNLFTKIITPLIAVSCPVFIIYSTVPMSEMLMLATLSSALAVAYISCLRQAPFLGIIAGILLGSIFAIRAESLIYFVPCLCICYIFYTATSKPETKKTLYFILVASALSAIFFWFPSAGSGFNYLKNHLKSVFFLHSYLLPGIFIFILAGCHLNSVAQPIGRLIHYFDNKVLFRCFGIGLMLLLLSIVYFRFFKGLFPAEITEQIWNMGRYGQGVLTRGYIHYLNDYTSSLLVFSGILGVGLILYSRNNLFYPILALFMVASIITLTFPRHSNTPYWLVRRYLVCVFPLFIFSSGAFLDYLQTLFHRKKIWKIIIICFWASASVYLAIQNNLKLDTVDQRSYVGLTNKFQRHVSQFTPEKDIILVDGKTDKSDGYQLAMKYLFQIETLNPFMETISDKELLNFYYSTRQKKLRLFLYGLDQIQILRFKRLFILEEESIEPLPEIIQGGFYAIKAAKTHSDL